MTTGAHRQDSSGKTPPPSHRGAGPRPALTEEFANALKANPGKWARIRTYSAKSSANTAAGKLRKMAPHFEFVARRDGASGSALYARWVDK